MAPSLEEQEDRHIAPWGLRYSNHGGRLHDEPEDPFRTYFQRDRDRILHSKAFRRLGYKTQVFANFEGDNYRTRLTHSLEVSQIARSVADTLQMNRDYAETLALAHDLGHTPFGHAGQETLHQLMEEHGGFEHNRQSLRIVSVLEERYPLWEGLNLTRSTLQGMMKHESVYESDRHLHALLKDRLAGFVPLESILVDRCDRIAYLHHDLEDGLDAGVLAFADVAVLESWKLAEDGCGRQYGAVFTEAREPLRVRATLRQMLNTCITDLIVESKRRLQGFQAGAIPNPTELIRNSPSMWEQMRRTYAFLDYNLYKHPDVVRMSRRGSHMIELLFDEFSRRPEMLPRHVHRRIERDGLFRVVSDYISGMTDRYAEKQITYLRA